MKEPIRKVVLADGAVRYRLVVDTGRDKDGRRQQFTGTYDVLKEARAELARIRYETGTGTYVPPSDQTVNEYLDEYLKGATRERRTSTKASYRVALRCPRERFGHRRLQSITKNDIEELVEYMQTEGRVRGGTPGTGLSPRSIRLSLGRLSAAFAMAVKEGRLVRNVVRLVEWPANARRKPVTWSEDQVKAFLTQVGGDRLLPAWRLSLYGLRRGEVLGLRWSDLDLKAKEVTISQARILVDYQNVIEPPKSENGVRTLPLDDGLVDEFKALRRLQAQESIAAGAGYAFGLEHLDWYKPGNAYVVTDEVGHPVHPEWYADEFHRQRRAADLPRIRLHDSRHTTFSLMEKAGVPISIISKWAGHCDPAFTMKTYVHATTKDLEVGREALAAIHKVAS